MKLESSNEREVVEVVVLQLEAIVFGRWNRLYESIQRKLTQNSVSTEADRRVHSTVTNGFINNIRIHRQPIKSTVNTSKPMSFAVLNTRSVGKKLNL